MTKLKTEKLVFLNLFILISTSLIFPDLANACSCRANSQPKESLQDSTKVFRGNVLWKFGFLGTNWVRFQVKEFWKGNIGNQITITTSSFGTACGINFDRGKEYIVYTYEKNSTSSCSRTNLVDFAKDDIDYLQEGKIPYKRSFIEQILRI